MKKMEMKATTRKSMARKKLTPAQRAARFIRQRALYIIGCLLILVLGIAMIKVAMTIDRKMSETRMHDFGRERMYAEYVVKSGDTLWSISADMASAMQEYGGTKAYLNDLESVNHVSDKIKAGQKLLLPYYEQENSKRQGEIFAAYGIKGVGN